MVAKSLVLALIPSGLHGPSAVLGASSEGDTELEEAKDDGGEVLEEEIVILGVLLDPRLELLVLNQRHIGGKHHEGLGGLVLVLFQVSVSETTILIFHIILPAWGRSTSSTATSPR